MEFVPQFVSHSRTIMVIGLMVWGILTYAASQCLARLMAARVRA